MNKTFRLDQVVKRYPGFVLGPIDLELEPGNVMAYVGRNGAGKTTTINCLSGLIRPDAGQCEIAGTVVGDPSGSWKQHIGYVGDRQDFFDRWTGEDNLAFLSRFYDRWDASWASTLADNLELPLTQKVGTLSFGSRVKLGLVAALASRPRLLLLDEPTATLDPLARNEISNTLHELMGSGETSILYSTHHVGDIGRLADEIAFLEGGRIILRAFIEDLQESWRTLTFRHDGDLPSLTHAVDRQRSCADHILTTSNVSSTRHELKEAGIEDVREHRLDIDEIAVQILKEAGHVAHA